MSQPDVEKLAAILRLAYSGELAAALAYRGHWHSLRDSIDRSRIRQIEEEEWRHRDLVGGMLAKIGMDPSPARERRARAIGRTLGLLCHVMGWLALRLRSRTRQPSNGSSTACERETLISSSRAMTSRPPRAVGRYRSHCSGWLWGSSSRPVGSRTSWLRERSRM